ncbi:MAG: rhodanese-like domain-containing protein [Gemmatimonadaceae bacterium]
MLIRINALARIACVALSLGLLAVPAVPGTTAAQQPVLVSSDWLAKRLGTPALVIIHTGMNRADYDAGHVPSARFLAFGSYAVDRDSLSTQLPPVAQLDSVLEAAGVDDASHVVIYGQPIPAARLFMTIEYLGLGGRVSVLDGGLDAWREEGRALATDAPAAAHGPFTPRPRADLVVDAAWVNAARTGRPNVVVLDARTPEFYAGTNAPNPMSLRPGHIPGAGNVPFTSLTGELTKLRSESALRRLFTAAGATPGKAVVTYCHIGMQASLLYLAARRLGYTAHLYDGAFEDWGRRTELPVTGRREK